MPPVADRRTDTGAAVQAVACEKIGRVRQDFLATREVAELARVRTIASCLNSGEFSYRQAFWPHPIRPRKGRRLISRSENDYNQHAAAIKWTCPLFASSLPSHIPPGYDRGDGMDHKLCSMVCATRLYCPRVRFVLVLPAKLSRVKDSRRGTARGLHLRRLH